MAFLVGYTQQLPCLFLLNVSTNVKPFGDNRLAQIGTATRERTVCTWKQFCRDCTTPGHNGVLSYRRVPGTVGPSVAPGAPRRRPKRARTVVAEKVVAREDVVDLQAVRAGIAFAYVALEKTLSVDELGASAVVEKTRRGGAPARLTCGRGLFHRPRFQGNGTGKKPITPERGP